MLIKKRNKNLKTKIILGVALFGAIFVLFFCNTTQTARADYSSSIDIDCERTESGYSKILEDPDYMVYYANSNDRHFLFVNSTNNLTDNTISIFTDDFSYDLSDETVETSFLKSYHVNNSFELEIERDLVGNEFTLSFNTDELDLTVDPSNAPSSSPAPIYIEGETEVEEEKVPMNFFDSMAYSINKMTPTEVMFWTTLILISAFIVVLLIIHEKRTHFNNPLVLTKNRVTKEEWDEILVKEAKKRTSYDAEIDYGKLYIKLGRFLGEKPSKIIPNGYVLYFKHTKHAILRLHCAESYISEVKNTTTRTVNIIQKEHWDYFVHTLTLPERDRPDELRLKKTWKNKIIDYLMRRLPSTRLPLKLEEKLTFEKTGKKIEKILLLQNSNDVDRLTLIMDVKYEKKVPTEKDPTHVEELTLTDEPFFMYHNLTKDETVIKNSIVITKQVMGIATIKKEHREFFKSSEDNIRSQIGYIAGQYMNTITDRNLRVDKLTRHISELEKNQQIKLTKEVAEIQQSRLPNYAPILKKVESIYTKSGDLEQAVKDGMLEVERDERLGELTNLINKVKDPDHYRQVMSENERLKQKYNALKKSNNNPPKKPTILDELSLIPMGNKIEEEE